MCNRAWRRCAVTRDRSSSRRAITRETVLAGRRTFCPGCSSCHQLGAEIEFTFSDISRYVTDYEHDGNLCARTLSPTARRRAERYFA